MQPGYLSMNVARAFIAHVRIRKDWVEKDNDVQNSYHLGSSSATVLLYHTPSHRDLPIEWRYIYRKGAGSSTSAKTAWSSGVHQGKTPRKFAPQEQYDMHHCRSAAVHMPLIDAPGLEIGVFGVTSPALHALHVFRATIKGHLSTKHTLGAWRRSSNMDTRIERPISYEATVQSQS